MDLSRSNQQLTNMNIITFIKEVYSSLKHITTKLHAYDTKLNTQHKDINEHISRLEVKLDHIINEQNSIKNMIYEYYNSDQNIGTDIQHKMENLLSGISGLDQDVTKLKLKPDDLTIANVDENNYTFSDIQTSLDINNITFNESLTTALLDDTDDLFSSVNFDDELSSSPNENKTNEENITDLVY
jgi:DNA-binding transcriptional MerR regulator